MSQDEPQPEQGVESKPDKGNSSLMPLSHSTPVTIGLAIVLFGCTFWFGRLSNTSEYQSELLKKHDEILTQLTEVASDNKRRIDWIDERNELRDKFESSREP